MSNDAEHAGHDHAEGQEELTGMAVGFRIFEDAGEMYLAEAEIVPYEDQPTALGVTLVFHSLAGIDPTSADEDDDQPWAFDFDDELTRDEGASVVDQTQEILRQLSKLSEEALREYLHQAREES